MSLRHLLVVALLSGCLSEDNDDDDGNYEEPSTSSCEAYISCAGEVAPTELGNIIETYGSGGSCWLETTAELSCLEVCQTGLDDLRAAFADPACWESGCGEFMAQWTAECGGLPPEHLCGNEWATWRDCMASTESCDPFEPECADVYPVEPGSEVYRPGSWSATWTSSDVSEGCDVGADLLPVEFSMEGDGASVLNVQPVSVGFFGSTRCDLIDGSFSCRDEITMGDGFAVQLVEGSFSSLETATMSYTLEIEVPEVACDIYAVGTIALIP